MTETAAQADAHAHDEVAHALPLSLLVNVFVALLVLTFATVAVTWVDLGTLNVWIALFIALIKAALVALYFMHLRYDSPFNAIVLICALLFVTLMLAFTIIDSTEYAPNYEAPQSVNVVQP